MTLISIVTPCFNEQENIAEIYRQVRTIFDTLPQYQYEHIFIDNASTDHTVDILKTLAKTDNKIKLIVNSRNFGHIRSPFYGMLQANGDAVILISADLQDPVYLIKDFLLQWQNGYRIVAAVKPSTQERFPMTAIRKAYYNLVTKIADIKLLKNFTGFGLYDASVIKILRDMNDSYPYFRGLICEIGFPIAEVSYHQPKRIKGTSKNNFLTLYDMAMLGITTHSKFPIRLATMGGFILSIISLIIAFTFLILKLLLWYKYPVGIAPILIGMFFFSSMQLFFIGILGEYVLLIHTQTLKRPLVIEKERINFAENG